MRQCLGVTVGEEPQASAPGLDAGRCGGCGIAPQRRVVAEDDSEFFVLGGRVLQQPCDLQMHQPTPRLGDAGIDGAPDQIVRKDIGAFGIAFVRAQKVVPFESFQRRRQPFEVERHKADKPLERKAGFEDAGPGQDLGSIGRQPGDAVAHDLLEGARQFLRPFGKVPRKLDGIEGIAAGLFDHTPGFDRRRDRPCEPFDVCGRKGSEPNFLDTACVTQTAQHGEERGVVGQFAVAGHQQDEMRLLSRAAHDEMQEFDRAFVAPLNIVHDEYDRSGGADWAEQLLRRCSE